MAKKKLEVKKEDLYLGKHYRVCVAGTPEELAKEVDSMITKSWRIAGGIAVNTKGYYQAMCKGV